MDLLNNERDNLGKGLYLPRHPARKAEYIQDQGRRRILSGDRAKDFISDNDKALKIIEKYQIGLCLEGEYSGRIIVPSFNKKGELNFFVSRSWNPRSKLKYKNPEASKDFLIFNESLIDWKKDIYLVEGVFDSFFLDNSICLLGKFLTDNLWEKLYSRAKKNIIVCLDGDAYTDAKNLYDKLNGGALYNRVKLVKLPKDKDVCDLKGDIEKYYVEFK